MYVPSLAGIKQLSSFRKFVCLEGFTMLSEKPIKIGKVEKKFIDREILRLAIIAELDAVSLYEQ
jgi:hypothetical protein